VHPHEVVAAPLVQKKKISRTGEKFFERHKLSFRRTPKTFFPSNAKTFFFLGRPTFVFVKPKQKQMPRSADQLMCPGVVLACVHSWRWREESTHALPFNN
jgi:hypothetical protein